MKSQSSILVVDDERTMLSLLEKILSQDGYQVYLATNGREALAVIEKQHVDIIITDVKMPELDGFGLLKIVKNEYPEISVIMMTGYGDTYTVKDALLLGADEYITKPFRSHEISLVVERTYWRMMSSKSRAAGSVIEA